MLRISGTVNDSIVDGPGLRFAVFTQGCPHNCPCCHNPQTHDFTGGHDCSTEQLWEVVQGNPLLDGVTLSGGEPLAQAAQLLPFTQLCKEHNLNIWIYTGYTWEELMETGGESEMALLELADVLVDGRFEQNRRSLDLLFRGSLNQRIIDVPASLKAGRAITLELG